jgi:glycosyltransferase involved in cell wall biosynthesis
MNWTQRVAKVPEEFDLTVVAGRRTEIDLDLPSRVTVRRAMLGGPVGYTLHAAWQMASARTRHQRIVVTDRSAAAVLAPILRRVGGYRWVLDLWDAPHKELVAFHRRSDSFGARLRRYASTAKVALLRLLARRADLVLLSIREESVADYRFPRERVRHYSNAIELPDDSLRVPPSRRPLSVCFVSRRILGDRRLDLLLDSLEALRKEGIDVDLRIAGELSPAAASLVEKKSAAGWIHLLGTIPVEEAQALMSTSRVGVIPLEANRDLSHIFPVKLLEYMAYGAVVVASDLPGIREIARDGTEAILVPPGDASALKAALATALSDDVLADRLAIAASTRVQLFDADAKALAIYGALRELALASR